MPEHTLNKKAGSEFESAQNYFMLLKPRVMSLAIFTALVGQILASHQSFKNPMLTFISLFSIALVPVQRVYKYVVWKGHDALMQKQKRPIPKGMVKSCEALSLGSFCQLHYYVISIGFNIYAGFLLACSILFYIIDTIC